jgi:hypothetical protein
MEELMSADVTSDLVSYHAFIKATLSSGGSLDEDASPRAYLEYQAELERLRRELQPAADRFRRGEPAADVDLDGLVERVLNRSAKTQAEH